MDKAEYIFLKLAEEKTIRVTDAWFKPRDDMKKLHEGRTFFKDSNVSIKTKFEGQGLKKYLGYFPDPNLSKGSTKVEDVQLEHKPILSREELKQKTLELRRKIDANS